MSDAPDYCYDADAWECTYPWQDRDDLTMDLAPGDTLEVACLRQLPTKWVCCIVRDDEWETLWFDTPQEAADAIAHWREQCDE